ncbi:MAG TPA: hypothetical protein PKE29_13190 [Phycisphaerales bacterium]|nr:hypothetical protein [Phycisphaerales bacterium]
MRAALPALACLTMAASLAACSGSRTASIDSASPRPAHTPPGAVAPASAAERASLLDRMKTLAGTWESTGEDGTSHTSSIIAVTSNGSAVREVMLPGTAHEMTNMYTMDGPSLVLTHYCAMGNQPRLRAVAGGAPENQIHLAFDGVSNLSAPDQMYMGQLTITFIDADHIRQEWSSFRAGVPAGHAATFELTRRR